MNWEGWVSSLLVGERKEDRMKPLVMRFSITETMSTGKRGEVDMVVEEVWMEPVLSYRGRVGEEMLDFMELKQIYISKFDTNYLEKSESE